MSERSDGKVFDGFADVLPPLGEGGQMVLGQIFSKKVREAYAVEQERWCNSHWPDELVGVGSCEEDNGYCRDERNRERVVKGLTEWLFKTLGTAPRAPAGSKEWVKEVLGLLPADPLVNAKVTDYVVGPQDRRSPLVGQKGCRAAATRPGEKGKVVITEGTVIGPYRARMMFTDEYSEHKYSEDPDFVGSMFTWRHKNDCYGVDVKFKSLTKLSSQESSAPAPLQQHLRSPAVIQAPTDPVSVPEASGVRAKQSGAKGRGGKATKGRALQCARKLPMGGELLQPEFEAQEYELISSAFMVGNLTCLVNDPSVSPPSNVELTRPENVAVFNARFGAWMFPIMIATSDIRDGEELAYLYGPAYWEMFNDQQKEIAFVDRLMADADSLKRRLHHCYDLQSSLEEIVEGREKSYLAGKLADPQLPGPAGIDALEPAAIEAGGPHNRGSPIQEHSPSIDPSSPSPPVLSLGEEEASGEDELPQTHRFEGVVQAHGMWQAFVDRQGEQIAVKGSFSTDEEAARARDALLVSLRLAPEKLAYPADHKDYIARFQAMLDAGKPPPEEVKGSNRTWWRTVKGCFYHGVIPSPKTGYWDVVVKDRRGLLLLGRFRSSKHAAVVWDLHARRHHLRDLNFSHATQQELKNAHERYRQQEHAEQMSMRLEEHSGLGSASKFPAGNLAAHSRDVEARASAAPQTCSKASQRSGSAPPSRANSARRKSVQPPKKRPRVSEPASTLSMDLPARVEGESEHEEESMEKSPAREAWQPPRAAAEEQATSKGSQPKHRLATNSSATDRLRAVAERIAGLLPKQNFVVYENRIVVGVLLCNTPGGKRAFRAVLTLPDGKERVCGKGFYEEAHVAGLAHDRTALRSQSERVRYTGRLNFPLSAKEVLSYKDMTSFLRMPDHKCLLAVEVAELPIIPDEDMPVHEAKRARLERDSQAREDSGQFGDEENSVLLSTGSDGVDVPVTSAQKPPGTSFTQFPQPAAPRQQLASEAEKAQEIPSPRLQASDSAQAPTALGGRLPGAGTAAVELAPLDREALAGAGHATAVPPLNMTAGVPAIVSAPCKMEPVSVSATTLPAGRQGAEATSRSLDAPAAKMGLSLQPLKQAARPSGKSGLAELVIQPIVIGSSDTEGDKRQPGSPPIVLSSDSDSDSDSGAQSQGRPQQTSVGGEGVAAAQSLPRLDGIQQTTKKTSSEDRRPATKQKCATPKPAQLKQAEPKQPEPKAAEPKAAEQKAAEPKAADPKAARPSSQSALNGRSTAGGKEQEQRVAAALLASRACSQASEGAIKTSSQAPERPAAENSATLEATITVGMEELELAPPPIRSVFAQPNSQPEIPSNVTAVPPKLHGEDASGSGSQKRRYDSAPKSGSGQKVANPLTRAPGRPRSPPKTAKAAPPSSSPKGDRPLQASPSGRSKLASPVRSHGSGHSREQSAGHQRQTQNTSPNRSNVRAKKRSEPVDAFPVGKVGALAHRLESINRVGSDGPNSRRNQDFRPSSLTPRDSRSSLNRQPSTNFTRHASTATSSRPSGPLVASNGRLSLDVDSCKTAFELFIENFRATLSAETSTQMARSLAATAWTECSDQIRMEYKKKEERLRAMARMKTGAGGQPSRQDPKEASATTEAVRREPDSHREKGGKVGRGNVEGHGRESEPARADAKMDKTGETQGAASAIEPVSPVRQERLDTAKEGSLALATEDAHRRRPEGHESDSKHRRESTSRGRNDSRGADSSRESPREGKRQERPASRDSHSSPRDRNNREKPASRDSDSSLREGKIRERPRNRDSGSVAERVVEEIDRRDREAIKVRLTIPPDTQGALPRSNDSLSVERSHLPQSAPRPTGQAEGSKEPAAAQLKTAASVSNSQVLPSGNVGAAPVSQPGAQPKPAAPVTEGRDPSSGKVVSQPVAQITQKPTETPTDVNVQAPMTGMEEAEPPLSSQLPEAQAPNRRSAAADDFIPLPADSLSHAPYDGPMLSFSDLLGIGLGYNSNPPYPGWQPRQEYSASGDLGNLDTYSQLPKAAELTRRLEKPSDLVPSFMTERP